MNIKYNRYRNISHAKLKFMYNNKHLTINIIDM